jgi:hypothetical protein
MIVIGGPIAVKPTPQGSIAFAQALARILVGDGPGGTMPRKIGKVVAAKRSMGKMRVIGNRVWGL